MAQFPWNGILVSAGGLTLLFLIVVAFSSKGKRGEVIPVLN